MNKDESENLHALVQHVQQLQEHTSKVYGAKFLLNGQDTRSVRRQAKKGSIDSSFSSLLTKLTASKQEAKQAGGGQNHSDTFKLYINPVAAASVGNSSTSALQVRSTLTKPFAEDHSIVQLSEIEQKVAKLESLIGLNEQQPVEASRDHLHSNLFSLVLLD